MPSIDPPRLLNKRRRSSHISQSSSGSMSSAFSATSAMSGEEVDNFRSMRGKAGDTSKDLSLHMNDDVDDLTDRLQDVKHNREIQKKLFDTTGEPYEILITSKDVRLMRVDEKGHYHFTHFNSEKHRNNAKKPIKQRWRVIDDEEADHTFVSICSSWVTVYHSAGVWQCSRYQGKVLELEDSNRSRPISRKIPHPGGKKYERETREWRLYADVDDSDRSSNATPTEPLLAANTPGEKGQHHRAHQSFYHDIK